MIQSNYKPSLVVAQQLPAYIRENKDYLEFIAFLEAYYEFLESEGNVIDVSRNVLNYVDVDNTIEKFEEYFFNEFLQDFPKESLTNKKELVKFSKELYQRKSTPAAFKFLFRALFNSESSTVNAKEFVLIASGGKWNVSKYLKLNTLDERFLETKFYKVFGETTNSIANIESSRVIGGKIELYVNDIIRNFKSGEFVKIVDDQLKDVLFDGEVLRSKIVGIIPKITIVPGYSGAFYKEKDPVVIFQGTNPDIQNPIKATAEVESVGIAGIRALSLINGSNGFREYPNTIISIVGTTGSGGEARVTALDESNPATINYIPLDLIEPYANVQIDAVSYGFESNPSANANTILENAFSLVSLDTYPILRIELLNSGSGYLTPPAIFANSYININSAQPVDIGSIGILKPIRIKFAGYNYSIGDTITFSGGSGIGAYANVQNVSVTGSITEVKYINNPDDLQCLGGILYSENSLPQLTIESTDNKIIYLSTNNTSSMDSTTLYFPDTSNVVPGMYISGLGIQQANTYGYFESDTTVVSVEEDSIEISNPLTTEIAEDTEYKIDGTALLYVDGILGKGASFASSYDKLGEILSIKVTNPGEDYVSDPIVSLRVIDVIVSNINELIPTENGDIIYQEVSGNQTFRAIVDSISILSDITRTFTLRLFSYSGTLVSGQTLYIDKTTVGSKEISLQILATYNENNFVNGIKIYGDGKAKANAEFVSGTVTESGNYLNSDGFISSSNFLESEIINDYSYFVVVEREFSKYKELLNNILHPAAKQAVTINSVKSSILVDINGISSSIQEANLKYITSESVYGELINSATLQLYELNKEITGISLSDIITSNTYINIESQNGEIIYSKISNIDDANDAIYISDQYALNYDNVAYGYVTSNSIVITGFTGIFDYFNGGIYSSNNKLVDIVYRNDLITISNNEAEIISSIDYSNNIIYVANNLNISGNSTNPELISIIRNFNSNNIFICENSQ